MEEAQEYHHHYAIEHQDEAAVSRLMELQGLHAQSFPPEAFALFRERFAAGHGVHPLVGTPDHIANELARVHGAGFDGTTLSFVDYVAELPYFAEEVIPRLERLGLRQPPAESNWLRPIAGVSPTVAPPSARKLTGLSDERLSDFDV